MIRGKTKAAKSAGNITPGDYAEYDREYKEEFWVGNCKIERKWEGDGSYTEERKCKGWD
jgi:hypothetical protein